MSNTMLRGWLGKLKQFFLTLNDCFKAHRHMKAKGIMLHSTGANNPYLHRYVDTGDGYTGKNIYGNDWNRPGVCACVHGFIGLDAEDNVGFVQTLPWDMRSWHCGAEGNDTHISIEICEDGLTSRTYFEETKVYAVKLFAALCVENDFDPVKPGVILSHSEGYKLGIASAHADVEHWWSRFGYTMDDFRADIAKAIAEDAVSVTLPPVENTEDSTDLETRVAALEVKVSKAYKTLDDVPNWAKDEIKRMCLAGLVQGDKSGRLNIPVDALQAYIVMGRAYFELKAQVDTLNAKVEAMCKEVG